MNKLPCKYKLYISLLIIGVVSLALLPTSCTCNCSIDDDVGGDWRPDDLETPFLYNVLFVSDDEIYVMNADGTDQTKLVTADSLGKNDGAYREWAYGITSDLLLSLDGKKILFSSRTSHASEPAFIYRIWTMNTDGTELTKLIDDLTDDPYPSWSPDGSKIAYVSDRDGNKEIYTMNSDGTNQTRLTNNDLEDWQPVWSPDGSKIAYSSETLYSTHIYTFDIFVMNSDGIGQTNITKTLTTNQLFPAWSPDGTKIAYTSDDNGMHISVVNADGTAHTRLTTQLIQGFGFDWSPDSTRIVFNRMRGGYSDDLYIVNADGSDLTTLTNDARINYPPIWSNDGSKITFVDGFASSSAVYIINVDGSEQTKLADGGRPVWVP